MVFMFLSNTNKPLINLKNMTPVNYYRQDLIKITRKKFKNIFKNRKK